MGTHIQRGVGRNSGRRRNRNGLNADINVTPFVDVMLVLLIVFMIVAEQLVSGVAIELPKTDAKVLPALSDPIAVSVDINGKVFIQETEISLDELVPKLVAISNNGYDERIYLRFTNIGLVTETATVNAGGTAN